MEINLPAVQGPSPQVFAFALPPEAPGGTLFELMPQVNDSSCPPSAAEPVLWDPGMADSASLFLPAGKSDLYASSHGNIMPAGDVVTWVTSRQFKADLWGVEQLFWLYSTAKFDGVSWQVSQQPFSGAFDPLDPEIVARVADSGVSVCPTLWVFHSACLGAEQRWDRDPTRQRGVAEPVRRSWRRFAEAYAASEHVLPEGIAGGLPKAAARDGVRNAIANLLLLRERKVPFAYGSDGPYGFSTVFRPLEELTLFEGAGLGKEECLRAATLGAAELLGLRDRGALRPGLAADLLWVDGDLTLDLSALARVRAVLRGGVAVSDDLRSTADAARAVRRGLGRTLAHAVVTRMSQSIGSASRTIP